MKPEQAVITLLENGVGSLSSRIYPGYAPQDAAMPFAVVGRDSTEVDHHILGASGLRLVRIGVAFYGPRLLALGVIAESAEAVLDTVNDRTTVAGINIRRLWIEDTAESQIELADGTGKPIHVIAQTYSMHYKEA
jgi:hypothetical protein